MHPDPSRLVGVAQRPRRSQADPANYRARIYESYAHDFQQMSGVLGVASMEKWGKAYQYYFRRWLPADRSASIVDLACGSGRQLHWFKRLGFERVSGVDVSPEQVALARRVVPDVAQQDIVSYLCARPDTFDLMTGLDMIEHFHKAEVLPLLDACLGALRTRGRLVLQTPNADSPWVGTLRYGDFTHEIAFNPSSLSHLLRLVGFENIEVRELGPLPTGYSVSSSARYVLWRMIRFGLKLWNITETGSAGSGIFTRTFLITGSKP